MKKIYAILVLGLLVSACASKDKELNLPAENLYNVAYENLEATKYKKAAEQFELLETQHPYSKWAVKAKLMAAYAYYKDENYDDAIMAADRFLKYHPGNKDADYAYYLKGMSYYDQITSAEKDQLNTRMAEETFERLAMLYPESKYTKDVLQKINLAEDYKAAQEMIVGRYYLNNGNYLSALNRFNVVLEQYQKTVQIEEALYREVEIYAILGMNKYANGYYKILKLNYPNSEWTEKASDVMSKIDVNEKPKAKKNNAENKAEETSSPWYKFGWPWFGGDNEEKAEENVSELKEEVSEEKAEEKVSELKEEVIEEKAEDASSSPWYKFGWPWFGGDNEEKAKEGSL